MAVSKVVTVVCDYPGCKGSQGTPAVVSWDETAAERGTIPAPPEAAYLVIFNLQGVLKSFCCQLHAAEFFLPPGYEAKQKDLIQLPNKRSHHKKLVPDWKDEPLRLENPVNGQNQADGFGPEETA
jgi:hypothetical protein